MCFFSPIGDGPKKHINKLLAPTQSQDNPANLFMFMCFSVPDNHLKRTVINGLQRADHKAGDNKKNFHQSM